MVHVGYVAQARHFRTYRVPRRTVAIDACVLRCVLVTLNLSDVRKSQSALDHDSDAGDPGKVKTVISRTFVRQDR